MDSTSPLSPTTPAATVPEQLLAPAPDVDASSLSPLVAFNNSYGTPDINQWGKRPADSDVPGTDETNKRQQLEIDSQIQAHIANEYQQAQQQQYYEEDGDEEEVEGEEPHPEVHPWMHAEPVHDPYGLMWDATMKTRLQSLPILENLSTQILQMLGKGPYTETLNIVTQPESDQGQAYNRIKSVFDVTKKLYTAEAFLIPEDLKLDTPEQRATLRRVNLATFVSSVFGSQEVGFFHLNEHFLDTFVPDGGRMLKSQGALFLDLKTQAYISAMATNERSKEEILEDLFPARMDAILLQRRPGAKQLTPSETDFVGRLMHRKNHLMQISDDVNLSEKYAWQEFLKDVSWYVSKNHETIVAQPMKRTRKRVSSQTGVPSPSMMAGPVHVPQQVVSPQVQQVIQQQQNPVPLTPEEGTAAAIVQAHTAALSASPLPNQQTPTDPALENADLLYGPNTSYMGAPPIAQPPVPQQSLPTQVLYERARLAATSKASPNARRAGLPSQRRPWTSDEEKALMAGLDRVKGPHWSQILAMYGPGGTVSEALKDRNQVQLKDKARNLKLFFLKSGIEVPYYLQFVTGELKTRAPGQAAKNAAKQTIEDGAEQDAAHVAAVTALANAHRANSNDIGPYDMTPELSQPPEGSLSDHDEMGSVPPPDMELQATQGMAVGHGPPEPQTQVAPQASMAPVAPMGIPQQDDGATLQDPALQTTDPNLQNTDPNLVGGVEDHVDVNAVAAGHEIAAAGQEST